MLANRANHHCKKRLRVSSPLRVGAVFPFFTA